jgi:hypothetical protein
LISSFGTKTKNQKPKTKYQPSYGERKVNDLENHVILRKLSKLRKPRHIKKTMLTECEKCVKYSRLPEGRAGKKEAALSKPH